MKKYISLIALFSIFSVFSQDLSEGYSANDLTQYPMQPLAKPAYLDAVTDSSFPNTSIRRISEANSGRSIVPMYSTIQAWNADESLLIVYAVRSGHRLLNGTDYTFIRDLSDIRPDDLEAVFWHFSDPDILFYMDNNTDDLIRYNVNTQSKTIIDNMRALSGCSAGLSSGNDVQMMSWDSDVFSFRCGNSSAFYYRISTGVLTEFNITDINYTAPMPFPSGNLFYHNTSVYDGDGNFVRDLNIEKGEHSCLGKLSNGDDAYFAISFAEGPDGGCLGTLVAHNATTGNCFAVTPTEDYGYSKSGTHISALAHKNSESGWVAVSSMGYEKDGVEILDQELFIAKVNEFDGEVYRVAHHRSDEDEIDYWGEPHVTISPSGTRLLFGSDWSGSDDGISVDAYVAELSAYTAPTPEEEDCASGEIIPEYRLDGVWESGENELTVTYGTEVMFSMLPNNIGLTIELPDGTIVGDDYNLGAVTPANDGPYLLTSSEGCTTIINLTVEGDEEGCSPGQIIPEYRLDGVWSSGQNDLTVAYGTEVMFSMLPNNIGVTVELPNGTVVGDDYNLGAVTPANSGPYLLTSSEGCTTVVDLKVTESSESCAPGRIIPEYRLNGVWSSGQNALTVTSGTEVMFSMLPNNISVTVAFPDGTVVGDDYNIGAVTAANSGTYVLTSSEGCRTTIDLTVTVANEGSSSRGETVSMVYPNPTKGELNIDLRGYENQKLTATVFNSNGQSVSEKVFNTDHASLERMSMNELPDGLYYLILESRLRRQVHSILVDNR
ncbi:T9SS type A sorting domain-containing protein [Aggregatimonas sangjinii]|uniref:T9SS type A sorting domain-containing protein n=1 Tax=Aggregatimonas sangjinii TaxID=2583587 RepID=A0A5B7SP03_9FLAO|nr:T9SS type A sorting domain-containing protein [Aggregatimonas sangjinii]QCW98747.1 T9SS type A sorting domain-containing protein [Aggregatimonas sangjinii]